MRRRAVLVVLVVLAVLVAACSSDGTPEDRHGVGPVGEVAAEWVFVQSGGSPPNPDEWGIFTNDLGGSVAVTADGTVVVVGEPGAGYGRGAVQLRLRGFDGEGTQVPFDAPDPPYKTPFVERPARCVPLRQRPAPARSRACGRHRRSTSCCARCRATTTSPTPRPKPSVPICWCSSWAWPVLDLTSLNGLV